MDDIDRRLVDLLVEDARRPTAELARIVGLSRTAALARIRRLEDSGVILGYHAEVAAPTAADEHAARVGIVVRTGDVAGYVRRLVRLPEVTEAESVAGEYDLLVRLSANSAARLDAVLDRIGAWPETVRTTTFVILRSYTG